MLSYTRGEISHQHAECMQNAYARSNVFLRLDDIRWFITDLDFALPALSALFLNVYESASGLNFTCVTLNVHTVK
jgi:hypothetical protein